MTSTSLGWLRTPVAWLAFALCAATGMLAWHDYTTTSAWQRSSGLLLERRADEALELLASAFSRDMHGAEASVLAVLGGAELTAFRITPGYVANFADLTGQVQIAIESADPALGHTMCFYGVGNHGGGPSKAMIEWIIAHRHSFEGHELVFSTPQAFMKRRPRSISPASAS